MTFQKYNGRYFEPTVKVETRKPKKLVKMAKYLDKIQKNLNYDEQTPEAIIDLLNAEEYVLFDDEYVSIKDNGKKMYRIYNDYGDLVTKKIALNSKKIEVNFDEITINL